MQNRFNPFTVKNAGMFTNRKLAKVRVDCGSQSWLNYGIGEINQTRLEIYTVHIFPPISYQICSMPSDNTPEYDSL